MQRTRPVWTRALRFYDALDETDHVLGALLDGGEADVHARSRFRHADDPSRYATYVVRNVPALAPPPGACGDHTLVVVREFRRVPLDSSGLGLIVFAALPGRAAQVIAALAHWVERAVSLYQPNYLLFAHSLEQPSLSALITGVRERRALEWSRPSPFSIDEVMPEVAPFLRTDPHRYVYCPDGVAAVVSPDAV